MAVRRSDLYLPANNEHMILKAPTLGADVITELRARTTVPIIVLSARVDSPDKVRALDRGPAAPSASPSQQAVRRERAVLLADALAGLPDDYREAIVLRHVEGLPFPEVAARMGRSVERAADRRGAAEREAAMPRDAE